MDRGSVLLSSLRPTGILSMNQVRPIIFPSGCHITETLIRYYHVSNYHCGMDRTISITLVKHMVVSHRLISSKVIYDLDDTSMQYGEPERMRICCSSTAVPSQHGIW
ncbi:hypothetical protein BLOT_005625 [Blomia tropicalis]|nr:hypothetical protein BLOT_005625 [Blomia tropicalis]